MQAALERYITEVQAHARSSNTQEILRGVTAASEALAATNLVVGPEYRHVPAEGHGRNLIFHDEEQGFVVVAMVWPPGHQGCVHDHSSWCVLGVLEGEVEIRNFRRTDDGSDPARAKLEETGALNAGVGVAAPVDPPPAHYHMVSNASSTRTAITLHTYGTDMRSCQVVDLATGRAEEVASDYHNQPACQG